MNSLLTYHNYRHLMKTGDILQWDSSLLLGKAIQIRKGGSVNHTGVIIRLSEYEGLERRVFTIEALEHGVVLNLLSKRLELFNGHCYLHSLRSEFDSQRQLFGERALSVIGTDYDYPAILQELFGNAQMGLDKLFCSELAWYSLTGKTEGEAPDPYEIEQYLSQWFIEPSIQLV